MGEAKAVDGLLEIPIGYCEAHPDNPRRRFDAAQLRELADSIKAQGILQPLLVRKVEKGYGYQVIAGERRLRAAKAAGLAEVPVLCRVLTDAEALEVQVIENLQREDLHPLEEAEGYEQLLGQITKAGRPLSAAPLTVEALAEKVGKSTSYIYHRMRLLALSPKSREAFYAEKLSLSVALALARIPNASVQAEALTRILEGERSQYGSRNVYPMSTERARALLRDEYMLALSSAPWRKDDADLLPAAGACSTCPKRTGAQPALFEDVKNTDTCTDTQCWHQKKLAWGKLRLEAARAEGHQVVEGEEAKRLLPWERGVAAGYDDVDHECWQDPKRRTLRQLLKVAGDQAPKSIVVADPHEPGKLRELVREKDVPEILKAAGVQVHRNTTGTTYVKSASQKAADAKRKLDDQVTRAILAGIHQSSAPLERADLEIIAARFFGDVWLERRKVILGLWGWLDSYKAGHHESEGFIAKKVKGLSDVELGRLLLDTALSAEAFGGSTALLAAAAKRAGVDAGKIRRELVAAAAAKRGEKGPRKRKGA